MYFITWTCGTWLILKCSFHRSIEKDHYMDNHPVLVNKSEHSFLFYIHWVLWIPELTSALDLQCCFLFDMILTVRIIYYVIISSVQWFLTQRSVCYQHISSCPPHPYQSNQSRHQLSSTFQLVLHTYNIFFIMNVCIVLLYSSRLPISQRCFDSSFTPVRTIHHAQIARTESFSAKMYCQHCSVISQ